MNQHTLEAEMAYATQHGLLHPDIATLIIQGEVLPRMFADRALEYAIVHNLIWLTQMVLEDHNCSDEAKNRMLLVAAGSSHRHAAAIVRCLLESGASIATTDSRGDSALHIAVDTDQPNADVIAVLRDYSHGVMRVPNHQGLLPEDLANGFNVRAVEACGDPFDAERFVQEYSERFRLPTDVTRVILHTLYRVPHTRNHVRRQLWFA